MSKCTQQGTPICLQANQTIAMLYFYFKPYIILHEKRPRDILVHFRFESNTCPPSRLRDCLRSHSVCFCLLPDFVACTLSNAPCPMHLCVMHLPLHHAPCHAPWLMQLASCTFLMHICHASLPHASCLMNLAWLMYLASCTFASYT